MYTETAKEIEHALWMCALSKMDQICIVFILTKQGKMVNVKEASTGNASRE